MILSETLLQQTRLHFPTFENEEVKISLIEKGGSGRKFYRIQFSPNQSVVLVKYTREQMENQRYVEIAEFLEKHHVRAPKIHFHDPNEGLIWIEDLGEHDLWSHRDEPWPARRPLYHSALEKSRNYIASRKRILRVSAAIFRRSSTPTFTSGSSTTFSITALGAISKSRNKSGPGSWRSRDWRKSQNNLAPTRGFSFIATFNRKT